jgi:hypothetical protein
MEAFWCLSHLTDGQLIEGTRRTLALGRQLTAELVAHLAEVEDRRLHLHAACASMFDYCVNRLGMSEDEACRRIDVARLARRFPDLYPALASGDVSLSVVALLKPYLCADGCAELLSACRGLSVVKVRELLAARFARAHVPSSVRKLPEVRRAVVVEAACEPSPPCAVTVKAGEGGDGDAARASSSPLKLEAPRSVARGSSRWRPSVTRFS